MSGYKRPELAKRNEWHYQDPTAYEAFSHEKEMEVRERELAKVGIMMLEIKTILRRYGFKLAERAKIQSIRSGNVYE